MIALSGFGGDIGLTTITPGMEHIAAAMAEVTAAVVVTNARRHSPASPSSSLRPVRSAGQRPTAPTGGRFASARGRPLPSSRSYATTLDGITLGKR